MKKSILVLVQRRVNAPTPWSVTAGLILCASMVCEAGSQFHFDPNGNTATDEITNVLSGIGLNLQATDFIV